MWKSFVGVAVLGLLVACQGDDSAQETDLFAEETTITELPLTSVSLDNLEAFQPASNNGWQVVGDAYADRTKSHDLSVSEGTGILVSQGQDAVLRTTWEHGDMDLVLEFMLAKDAQAKLRLQGRYEVSLNDSWGQTEVTPESCGGTGRQAPSENACKAPGLWQHIQISFKAPELDNNGNMVSDARLAQVILNGETIQQEVTLAEASATDASPATTPLVIQGQGIAIKRLEYKQYGGDQMALRNMQYAVYEGMYRNPDTLASLQPEETGSTDTLSFRVGIQDRDMVFSGEMEIPRAGNYLFRLSTGGESWLYIDDQEVVNNQFSRNYQQFFYGGRYLEEGTHPFRIVYANRDESLVLGYQGPGIPWTTLTTVASYRRSKEVDPLPIVVENEPVIQRGFMMHGKDKNAYAMSVGLPGGLNYAYDVNAYAPLQVWHGDFLDVSLMWRDRGEPQLEQPMGANLPLVGVPTVAALSGENPSWPDSIGADQNPFTQRGYRLQNGLPIFFYHYKGVAVEDFLHATPDQTGLQREVSFDFGDTDKQELMCLLGSGRTIEQLPNGAYAIDGKRYYIENIEAAGHEPKIRQSGGQEELVVPVSGDSQVRYSIIW
ncbi:PA14 domain-containing protein [Catalinimonas alkaloidigena]|uniref:PA14 domain-containing protein n=1 Tax=Catalinimonas alkaloidigena TaxID=1075417 RepID=A0A1G9QII5_9BACT|nr:family 16 glycoside hydrolase [Catalinimonas alkaloidigena]SDM10581.1 PA14 domain-containing protein [Catalinimonas alkaloidigena]